MAHAKERMFGMTSLAISHVNAFIVHLKDQNLINMAQFIIQMDEL
jgi:hypothetical protein